MSPQPPSRYELHETGTNLSFALEVEEDLESEIQHFAKLSRTGNYAKAHDFFNHVLKNHTSFFPVAVEYADMLHEQGCYRQLSNFLEERIGTMCDKWAEDEMQLLQMMKALADMYYQGMLGIALGEATRAWHFLASRQQARGFLQLGLQRPQNSDNFPSDVDVYIFEIHMSIIAFAVEKTWRVDEIWTSCPFFSPEVRDLSGCFTWYEILKGAGFLWQASRILRSLLPLLPFRPQEIRRIGINSPDNSETLNELGGTRFLGPDMWALFGIHVLQAEYLLNVAILANAAGAGDDTTREVYESGRNQLETAERIWRGLPKDGDSLALNSRLSMEQNCYETAKALLFPDSNVEIVDPSAALSKILSEAESLCDFRTQMRCRFQLLLITLRTSGDWRDLYSMLKLQENDCGNFVESLHTWNLFASWTLGVPISGFNLSKIPNIDRNILFLSLIKPLGWPGQNWIGLLRSHYSKARSLGLRLAWDVYGDGNDLLIDIPNYTLWSENNKNQLLVYKGDTIPKRETLDLLGLSAALKSEVLDFVQHNRRPRSESFPSNFPERDHEPGITYSEDEEEDTVFKAIVTEAQEHVEETKKQERRLSAPRLTMAKPTRKLRASSTESEYSAFEPAAFDTLKIGSVKLTAETGETQRAPVWDTVSSHHSPKVSSIGAHPTINTHTKLQATNKTLPGNHEEGLGLEATNDPEQDSLSLEADDNNLVPPFLRQSHAEIHVKFEELEWMQRARHSEAIKAHDPTHPWALEEDPEVNKRNRYLNVQPWANSRIHLRVPDGQCDYINASPIVLNDSVSGEERRYIAAQGPKVGNIVHFWQMVFHETKDVGVIVMLTQTFEIGREKCSQYFPLHQDKPYLLLRDDENDPIIREDNSDDVVAEIKLLKAFQQPESRLEVRKLQLTIGAASKEVWHFHFTGWADYSSPVGEERGALLQLIELLGKKTPPDNPRIVHCSAGVGRTGTFIALDYLLHELESGHLLKVKDPDTDPVFETVNRMREQRMMMVYNEMQLQFIYGVLREQVDIKLGVVPTSKSNNDETSYARPSIMPSPPRDDFQIGWICTLPIEAAAAREMLDENFGILEEQDAADSNTYTLGRIGRHYVVIACRLGGQYGTTSATTVVNNMLRTFSRSLRIGLMVGVGSGIPSAAHDIRLGDVVISYPQGTCSGVIQYDMGKVVAEGEFQQTGSLNSPPRALLTAVSTMRAAALRDDPRYLEYLQSAIGRTARTRKSFGRPAAQCDRLFKAKLDHPANASSCDDCPAEWEVTRSEREESGPQPHYGIIASGNSVIKHGETREQLRLKTGALCFEMEAAGLMFDFPCIVIRGVCDYADSHKYKQWQGYAALAAAAYTKELLGYVPVGHVSQEALVVDVCREDRLS